MRYRVAIISTARPGRVQQMRRYLRGLEDVTWIVGEREAEDYRYAGALDVIEGGRLSESRNLALEMAFQQDAYSVQLSDDLTGIEWCPDRQVRHRIDLRLAITMIIRAMEDTGAKLGGAGATDNAFFIPKDDISTWAFIIGDLMVAAPSEPRFDTKLRTREDLEYSIQHLKEYGRVARVNTILANWQHRTNAGGAVAIRTPELERWNIDYIEEKHPGWTRLNPARRDRDEILLRSREAVLA